VVSRVGTGAVVVVFLAGLWLLAAPFALRFQPARAGWAGVTRVDVTVGGVLAVAGFIGLFGVLAGRVREMYAEAASVASMMDSPDSVRQVSPRTREFQGL
jgi:hypothetical protein